MKPRILIYILLFFFQYNGISQVTYDRDYAAEFAKTYWNYSEGTIPLYPTVYPNNDCANFVSICLKEGGLDLTQGYDGNGGGVNAQGCIPFCDYLNINLVNYQQATISNLTFNSSLVTPDFIKYGDVAIVGNSSDSYMHAVFAGEGTGASTTYWAHTENRENKDITWFDLPSTTCTFYHIKQMPKHCYNCVQDGNETGIDIGGDCEQSLPGGKKYESSTNSLPLLTLTSDYISAGNLTTPVAVNVLSGQRVIFSTGNQVTLLPGFWANSGSEFSARIKTPPGGKDNNDCGALCTVKYSQFQRPNNIQWEMHNCRYYKFEIYQYINGNMQYIYGTPYTYNAQQGLITFWNGYTGVDWNSFSNHNQFNVFYELTGCSGDTDNGSIWIYLADSKEASDSTGNNGPGYLDNLPLENNTDINSNINIYPNPANNFLTIELQNIDSKGYTIDIMDIVGNKTLSQSLEGNNTINTSSIAQGFYTYSIKFDNKVIKSGKLVISH